MKPLPDEDAALSARIWASDWSTVEQTPPSGRGVESAAEARAFYVDYVTRLPNSWLREGDLARWDLVVDPAAGAWSGLAAQVLEESSPLSVREVNALGGGRVNENGGVVALEGRRVVEGADTDFIGGHAGVRALFEAGRARREELIYEAMGWRRPASWTQTATGATPSSTIRFETRFTSWTGTTRSSCSRVS